MMYQLYPVVQLKAEEAKSAPFYTSNDYQKDCLLGTGDSLGFVFYQALEKAAQEIEKPFASYDKGKDIARSINSYFYKFREQIAPTLQDYLCAHDGRVDRWPDPDTGYELTLRSEYNNYLDGIFQFHFLAGDYRGKGSISYKFSRPPELCKPDLGLLSMRKAEIPEYKAYKKTWHELYDQVEKAGIFSKRRAQRAFDEFKEANKALEAANRTSRRNYDALLDAWLDAWLACCTAKGLRVTDPDVKERRQEENA